ncbi:hypothetical protein [Verrucomicrobium spinosum]|uniref:hypothetical protein n=1 Tax=Verrucomicrobium spinosum TaxID=2736 RepID=UPI0012E2E2B0|nr:hypothetical protein [Verrucomicrobium spinosum]
MKTKTYLQLAGTAILLSLASCVDTHDHNDRHAGHDHDGDRNHDRRHSGRNNSDLEQHGDSHGRTMRGSVYGGQSSRRY